MRRRTNVYTFRMKNSRAPLLRKLRIFNRFMLIFTLQVKDFIKSSLLSNGALFGDEKHVFYIFC